MNLRSGNQKAASSEIYVPRKSASGGAVDNIRANKKPKTSSKSEKVRSYVNPV